MSTSEQGFLGLPATGATQVASSTPTVSRSRGFRIRTITAGVKLGSVSELETIEKTVEFLRYAYGKYNQAGYEIQTLRIATQPLPDYLSAYWKMGSIAALKRLDRIGSRDNISLSIGPVITGNRHDDEFPIWASRLITETSNICFSVAIASPAAGKHKHTITTAAEAILAIAKVTGGGEGNFRFAAAANCSAGTPFFPVAYHLGQAAFSIGLESPPLLQEVFAGLDEPEQAKLRLKTHLESKLQHVQTIAHEIAETTSRKYLGIDASPAPGPGSSIGEAIEMLTRVPFGDAATLTGCSAITTVLQSLEVEKCGFCGLMLPVLEDAILASRAKEGKYDIRDLLLYSSVCGVGLDVVPLAGDLQPATLASLICDLATLSVRLRKPLSARLLPIPGKQAGQPVKFCNPYLTEGVVMELC